MSNPQPRRLNSLFGKGARKERRPAGVSRKRKKQLGFESLESRQDHEFVKVSFKLDWLIADQAVEELKPMLSPYGKLVGLKATNRIEAIDAVANLREIASLLSQEQSANGQERLVLPRRQVVHRLGDDLLAGARFAIDEHRPVRFGDGEHLFLDATHRGRLADETLDSREPPGPAGRPASSAAPAAARRSTAFSRTSRRCSTARLTATTSSSPSNGLVR